MAEIVAAVEDGVVQIVTPNGTGSGFIFDGQGWILTNAHVVGNNDTVSLVIEGNANYQGHVVGIDEEMDLAVIELYGYGGSFTEIPMASFGSVEVGDDAIAIGFPLGSILQGSPSITKGVISSKRLSGSVNYLQTDAAINPGNSGGPLLSSDGRVIGINTSKIESVFGRPIEGIGLAISIEDIQQRLDFLMSGGVVRLPWETYRDDRLGFSIDVPPNWTVTQTGDTTTVEAGGGQARFFIYAIDLEDFYFGLQDYYLGDQPLRNFADSINDFHVRQAEDRNAFYEPSTMKRKRESRGEFFWVTYLWQSPGFCSEDRIEIIALSSDYPSLELGFYAVGSICEGSIGAYIYDRLGMLDSFRF